jgi:cyclopropane fatty-acyl-phospholipid synthase-like methyltransferase
MQKPYAESADQNKDAILTILRQEFQSCREILEIGSGTGQHAVYFARHLPHLRWQTSELEENLPGIRLWLEEAGLGNLLAPVLLDVGTAQWPAGQVDGLFSANTAHIMSEANALSMLAGAAQILRSQGRFCLYGPFLYDGQHTSESNARFDAWLKARDPQSGVRDVTRLAAHGATVGLELVRDHAMPANNRILVWEKSTTSDD